MPLTLNCTSASSDLSNAWESWDSHTSMPDMAASSDRDEETGSVLEGVPASRKGLLSFNELLVTSFGGGNKAARKVDASYLPLCFALLVHLLQSYLLYGCLLILTCHGPPAVISLIPRVPCYLRRTLRTLFRNKIDSADSSVHHHGICWFRWLRILIIPIILIKQLTIAWARQLMPAIVPGASNKVSSRFIYIYI